MDKLMLVVSTVSLAIMAGGTLEGSYQNGLLGQVINGTAPRACPVIELARGADEASTVDAIEDAHATAQRVGCSTLAIVEA